MMRNLIIFISFHNIFFFWDTYILVAILYSLDKSKYLNKSTYSSSNSCLNHYVLMCSLFQLKTKEKWRRKMSLEFSTEFKLISSTIRCLFWSMKSLFLWSRAWKEFVQKQFSWEKKTKKRKISSFFKELFEHLLSDKQRKVFKSRKENIFQLSQERFEKK